MVKKADKRKKRKKPTKPKTKTIKQKQKQVQIVNVYYDKGKRNVAYKRRSPVSRPPPQPRPPLVIPEVRHIANYGSDRENDLIKLLALSSNQMKPTEISNQVIYDRLKNQGFLDLLQKNIKKEQGAGEQGGGEQGAGEKGGGEQGAGEKGGGEYGGGEYGGAADLEYRGAEYRGAEDRGAEDEEYTILKNVYRNLYKYVRAQGKIDYLSTDGRVGRIPNFDIIEKKIEELREKYLANKDEWSRDPKFVDFSNPF